MGWFEWLLFAALAFGVVLPLSVRYLIDVRLTARGEVIGAVVVALSWLILCYGIVKAIFVGL